MNRTTRKLVRIVPIYLFLLLMCVVVFLPLASLLSAALQPSGTPVVGLQWPASFEWGNFSAAWTKGSFSSLMASSFIVALGVVPIATLISVLAGYAFGTYRFPGSNSLFYLLLLGLVMPYESTIVPLYFNMRSVGLTDNYLSVILPEIGLYVCFGTFWMRTAFQSVPRSLVEAARLDGASSVGTLFQVLLPIVRPSILTLATLFFIWSWNEFLIALVMLQSPALQTAPAGLGLFVGQHTSDVSGLAAGAIIISIPVVLVYVVLNRKIISGMLQGAVKG